MSNATQEKLNLIATIKRQQQLFRILVTANVAILCMFLLSGASFSTPGSQPVDEIIFKQKGESQWRISVIENAICFDVKRWHEGNNPDDSRWKSVAQLSSGMNDFGWVRFDVGNVDKNPSDVEKMNAAMASIGIEVDRGLSLPYLSAIQTAPPIPGNRPNAVGDEKPFPFGDNVNHATLGFGLAAPPPSGLHGASTGVLSFSPSLTLSEIRPDKWAATIYNPNPGREPQLELKIGETNKKYSTHDSR